MPKFNPFAKLDNPKAVWAWAMYDLANQSFQLVINTLLFGVYLQKVVASSEDDGRRFWSYLVSGSFIVVVVLSPVIGAMVDAKSCKARLLVLSGLAASILTACLALVGKDQLWLAAALYIPAAILVGLGENVLAAFLPDLASPRNMGFVSALGWTMSYVGAIVLQLAVLLGVAVFDWKTPEQWRPLFVFSGVWFALGVIPSMLFLRDRPRGVGADTREWIIAAAFRRLGQTIREAVRYRQLKTFLLVFFVYSLGTQTAVYFAGSIATDFGFSTQELFLMTLLLSLSAGATSVVLAKYQDRWGSVPTLRGVLAVWFVTIGSIAALYYWHAPKAALWIPAAGIGIGFGGIGTASRALVGCFTPPEKSAEFFGLWGMIYKGAGVAGPFIFAWVWSKVGATAALAIMCSFFVLGALLLYLVKEREGIAAVTVPAPTQSA